MKTRKPILAALFGATALTLSGGPVVAQDSCGAVGGILPIGCEQANAGNAVNAPARAGDTVTLQSALNYPAFVTRAEVRVIDLNARGGPRTLAVTPIAPNGSLRLVVPEGDNIVVVHRVYDAAGRFDETTPLSLRSGTGNRRAAGGGLGRGCATRPSGPFYHPAYFACG